MPNQLISTWLPPETRIGWDGTQEKWPIDYGSGEYRNLGMYWEKNPWADWITMSYRISMYWNIFPHSENIRTIREYYEFWSMQKTKELQKLTDGKNTITIDDVLWYLRYENLKNIQELLWETSTKNDKILQVPSWINNQIQNWKISHRLLHLIQKSIEKISWLK